MRISQRLPILVASVFLSVSLSFADELRVDSEDYLSSYDVPLTSETTEALQRLSINPDLSRSEYFCLITQCLVQYVECRFSDIDPQDCDIDLSLCASRCRIENDQ